MASNISQIKEQVSRLGKDTGQVAMQTKQLEMQLSKQIALIEQLIGGTSDSTDKQLIASLEAAKQSVSDAALSLLTASQTANKYAMKL